MLGAVRLAWAGRGLRFFFPLPISPETHHYVSLPELSYLPPLPAFPRRRAGSERYLSPHETNQPLRIWVPTSTYRLTSHHITPHLTAPHYRRLHIPLNARQSGSHLGESGGGLDKRGEKGRLRGCGSVVVVVVGWLVTSCNSTSESLGKDSSHLSSLGLAM